MNSLISVSVTNEQGFRQVFPMYLTQWGSPEFTEEVAEQLHAFVGHNSAWHDMTYAMYDGGQSSYFFERNEHDNEIGYPEPSYSYEVLLNNKTCANDELDMFFNVKPESIQEWQDFLSDNPENA